MHELIVGLILSGLGGTFIGLSTEAESRYTQSPEYDRGFNEAVDKANEAIENLDGGGK